MSCLIKEHYVQMVDDNLVSSIVEASSAPMLFSPPSLSPVGLSSHKTYNAFLYVLLAFRCPNLIIPPNPTRCILLKIPPEDSGPLPENSTDSPTVDCPPTFSAISLTSSFQSVPSKVSWTCFLVLWYLPAFHTCVLGTSLLNNLSRSS